MKILDRFDVRILRCFLKQFYLDEIHDKAL